MTLNSRWRGEPVCSIGSGHRVPRPRWGVLVHIAMAGVLGLVAAATLLALAQPHNAFADVECANQEVRVAQNALYLPDCRAYEKVSPHAKGEADVGGLTWASLAVSSDDGKAFAYSALGRYPGAAQAGALPSIYRATLTDDGWINEGLNPPYKGYVGGCAGCGIVGYTSFVTALSPSLDEAIVGTNSSLVPGASDGHNYYRQTSPGSDYVHLTPGIASGAEMFVNTALFPYFQGASADLSTIVFGTAESLTPDAPSQAEPQANLYASVDGTLEYISTDENGDPIVGAEVVTTLNNAFGGPESQNAVSATGDRIFFSRFNGGPLYARLDVGTPQSRTIQIPDSNGALYAADPSGTRVVYEYHGSGSVGIAIYDIDADQVYTPTGAASGVTFVAASADATTVYFTTGDDLDPANPLPPGTRGLYFWSHTPGGEDVRLVAAYDPGTGGDVDSFADFPSVPSTEVRVASADGSKLAFAADEELAGFEWNGTRQIYLFDAEDQDEPLECISCPPEGEPAYDAALSGTGFTGNPGSLYTYHFERRNNISADGERVFFQTADALVPRDANGKVDVYVWDGETHLISTGTEGEDARFVGASPDGDGAFFVTRNRILPDDIDSYADLYVARVGGGFLAESGPAPCTGEDCQDPPPATPPDVEPDTSQFEGPGNPEGQPRDCTAHERRAAATKRKAAAAKRKAQRAKRRAASASGKRAARLRKQARSLERRAKRLSDRAAKQARRAEQCKRGAA